MKIYKTIVALALLISGELSANARILEMDNDELDKAFRGSGLGINYDDLARELNTEDGPALIQKFLSDKRLKETLYGQMGSIRDEHVRDELLVLCLRDHSIWSSKPEGMLDAESMWANIAGECIFKRFPSLGKEKKYLATLYTVMSPQGREAVATAYQVLLDDPADQSGGSDTGALRLLDELEKANMKYGTKESADPTEPGLPPLSNKPAKWRLPPGGSEPERSSTDSQETSANVNSPLGKSWWPWAAAATVALITTCLAIQFRFRKSHL